MQARLMPGFCFAARIETAPRCHPETIPGAQKQKIGSGCNFFAIADCRVVPIRRSRLKKCSKQLQNGPFFALWEWKRIVCRKLVSRLRSRGAGFSPPEQTQHHPEPVAFYTMRITPPSRASPRWPPRHRPWPSPSRRPGWAAGLPPTSPRP